MLKWEIVNDEEIMITAVVPVALSIQLANLLGVPTYLIVECMIRNRNA